MNHEIIHALKNIGVFTDKEWKTLTDAAKETNYVMIIDVNLLKESTHT